MNCNLTKILIIVCCINCEFSYSQDRRVKSIKQIIETHGTYERIDTIQTDFYYKDSILNYFNRKRSGSKYIEKNEVCYQPFRIQIKTGIRINKEFQLDSLNRITKYISNGYNYSVKYDNKNRLKQLLRGKDTLALIFYNSFHRYKKTIDSLVHYNREIIKFSYDYNENIQTALSNHAFETSEDYYFYYAPGFMTIIIKSGGLQTIHDFYYNEKNVLIKEVIKVFTPRLTETHTIIVDYENIKGNEDFLFNIYNWRYNYIIGVRTFDEYIDARY